MIEFALEDRYHERLDLTEIHQPAGALVHLACHAHLDPPRVTVGPGALVLGRHAGEPVGGLEAELLRELDAHGAYAGARPAGTE